jgi:hypothetical protein
MGTTIITSLALGMALVLGSCRPLGQGTQEEIPVACLIKYDEIGVPGGLGEELVVNGPTQSAVANHRGTPPDEAIELVCQDQLPPRNSTFSKEGFPCDVFRGRRGGPQRFETTNKTSIQIDREGRVTMRCTVP